MSRSPGPGRRPEAGRPPSASRYSRSCSTGQPSEEADFVRRLFTGGLRQGALAGLMVDAIAKAAGVPGEIARRALMLSGDLTRTAELAITERRGGASRGGFRDLPADLPDARLDGRERVRGGRRLRALVGRVEARRDPHPDPPPRRRGAHLHPQPQRDHGLAPGIVDAVRRLPVSQAVFDGEALWMSEQGPPRSRTPSRRSTARRRRRGS